MEGCRLFHYYEFPAENMVKRYFGIRTEHYKLIHFYYDIDEWELYDLKADLNEMKNVYSDPAYAVIKANLHKKLDALRVKYGDSDALAKEFIENYIAHNVILISDCFSRNCFSSLNLSLRRAIIPNILSVTEGRKMVKRKIRINFFCLLIAIFKLSNI
jgi:hypothetical protein